MAKNMWAKAYLDLREIFRKYEKFNSKGRFLKHLNSIILQLYEVLI